MEPDITTRLNTLEDTIDRIYVSVEKTRKYFLTSAIITIAAFVVPLIGLAFAVPAFLSNYVGQINSADSDSSNSVNSLNSLNSLLQ